MKLFMMFLLAVALSVCSVQGRAGQDQTLNLTAEDYKAAFLNQEPIKIVDLYVGSQKLKSGQGIAVGEDWLRDFRVVVKNVSDQGIKQIKLNLELQTGDPRLGDRLLDLFWGRDYFFNPQGASTADNKEPDLLLLPGESTSISFNPHLYDVLKAHLLHEHGYALPNKGVISLQYAVFEDGDHCWDAPRYYVRVGGKWERDPQKPYNLVRPNTLQGRVKRVGTRGDPRITCWDTSATTQEWCTTYCPSCKYQKQTITANRPTTVMEEEVRYLYLLSHLAFPALCDNSQRRVWVLS